MSTKQPTEAGKARMRNAILTNMRRREEKNADLLRERGWAVLSPYWVEDINPTPEQKKQSIVDQNAAADVLRQLGWKVASPYTN